MISILKKTVFFALLIISNIVFSQNLPLSEKAKVSVITCDTGNESYSLFGHTAIRITDIDNNLDVVYNYGAFDFATPNFVAKFAKGDLQYFAIAHSFQDFLNQYTFEQRTVFEQELLISRAYKQKLFDNLNAVLASEKKYYTYKFIDKNCTSMVVDILNQTLGSKIIFKKTDTDKTYRSILYPYFDNSFYEKLGTSIIFGKKVDELGTRIFLPLELHKNLATTQFGNQLLSKKSETLLEFKKETSKSWWNTIYTLIAFLAIVVILNKRSVDLFYLTLMGVFGIFFVFMGFYSFHLELEYNYNILLFNPFLLLLIYFYARQNRKWIINSGYLNVFLVLIYVVFMLNKIHLLIVLPFVLTNIILLTRIIIKNSKRIPVII
ncbi:DUF4105 domain-containing protein [Flavobacterium eburneipallidum]|uniref:lipoprotein N-acyltransferase Lnb domain-containing protein n=1 Tax=Flavobacterium eburneipallidum TaxID=3003263 RepID=UPI002483150C|nr:DUF4105 domain-containing protein [Flavobacterium eburneipallidum]